MPTAALRPCAGGCGARVRRGRCEKCERPSASKRGYNQDWIRFRPRFIQMLLDQGITPCCGASLPTGPQTSDSLCKQKGMMVLATNQDMHHDHEPPLTHQERLNPAIVCDPNRIQLLCADCHRAKTQRETTGGRVNFSGG